MFLPKKDSYSLSRCKINSQIASLFGGRIAEELIYGKKQCKQQEQVMILKEPQD